MLLEILLIIIVAIFFATINTRPKGLPPGEWGLPIVGYLPLIKGGVHKTIEKLKEKHGKIFMIKCGSILFTFLCDYHLIKEAFKKPEFSGRPKFYTFSINRKYSDRGLIFSEKEIWSTNRSFLLKSLKNFGLGKSSLEEAVKEEATIFIHELRKEINKPYAIDWNINVAIFNVIWKIVADLRYDINDKEIKEFANELNSNIQGLNGPMYLMNLYPHLIKFLPTFIRNSWMKEGKMISKRDKVLKYFSKIIEEHKNKLDSSKPKDFIDSYLIEMSNQCSNPSCAHMGDEDLIVELMDIFLAGSHTTASSLRWLFLYMAKYPQVQRRVQEEIDRVLPRDKFPTMQDKKNLPCLEALTYELSRKLSLLPTAVPHCAIEDSILDGFLIPKGTVVIAHLQSCNKDPRFWKHPNEFSLENFLDENGLFVHPKEGFASFSMGRRQCVGENLAKMELFIFVGAILQNFNISEPDGQCASLEPKGNVFIMNCSQQFKVVLQSRP